MREYYQLVKPGIVYGNVLVALATFAFAAPKFIGVPRIFGMGIGLALCIAAACVLNNIIDRDIDTRMARTHERALVTGKISVRSALWYAGILFLLGSAILFLFTNTLALLTTWFGVVVYVGMYTPLKRRTEYSTLVGAVAGAVPPVVGYVTVTNSLDVTALLLFLMLVCWQMTHFFAIGLYRIDEYRNAGLPIMPVQFGTYRTKLLMVLYAVLFTYAAYVLYVVQHLGMFYVVLMSALSIVWILLSLFGFFTKNTSRWARLVFWYSIILIVLFPLTLALS